LGEELSVYRRFCRKYYPSATEVYDVPLLVVVVPNKILFLGEEMELKKIISCVAAGSKYPSPVLSSFSCPAS